MAAITKRLVRLTSLRQLNWASLLGSAALATAVFLLARKNGWWPGAVGAVVLVELWWARYVWRSAAADKLMRLVFPLAMGAAIAVIVTLNTRLVSQVVIAALYGYWHWRWMSRRDRSSPMTHLLIVQGAVFEALFLVAAVWRTWEWAILGLVWISAFVTTLAALRVRGERSAGALAAAWGLMVVEVSWVMLLWLFTYVGDYVLVPQPTLVLVALAYCFGNIYIAARSGSLSRARLVEYLVIGLILVIMVIAGTPWRAAI